MKVLLQRVNFGSVEVDGVIRGEIEQGLVLLTGFGKEDTEAVIKPMAEKVANLRIFSDDKGRFDKSLLDVEGAALVVPQFTLYADTRKGRRPEFFNALEPKLASSYVENFIAELGQAGIPKVESGVFGAHMKVKLENDGPVTIMLEISA